MNTEKTPISNIKVIKTCLFQSVFRVKPVDFENLSKLIKRKNIEGKGIRIRVLLLRGDNFGRNVFKAMSEDLYDTCMI